MRAPGLLLVVLGLLASACAPSAARPAAAPTAAPAQSQAAAPPAAPAPAAPAAASAPATAAPAAAPASAARPVAVPVNPPVTVRVASVGLAGQAPTYMAYEQGYFRELGLNVELIAMNSTNEIPALLSTDQLEVGFGAFAPSFFNAAARGVGVRMVADHGSSIPGRSTVSLAVRADLLERKPWSGYADLRGMRVATQAPGTQTEYHLELMLKRAGLTLSDVELTALAFPDMAVAFVNRGIDAAMFNEPWATQQEQAGIIRKVAYADDVDPHGHVAAVLYSDTFARNTPAARNYMVALLRGVRDYWDAYDGRKDLQLVVDALRTHTALKDEALIRKIPPTGQNPGGYIDLAKLNAYQDWFADRGTVTRKADLQQAYDASFVAYANAVLGPYQP